MERVKSAIIRNRILQITTVLVMIIIAAIVVGLMKKPHEPTLQGQVDTTDYRVCTKVPSRVEKLLVSEGQYVHKGDTLVILSSPELNATESEAYSDRAAKEAMEDLTQSGTRREKIASAYQAYQQTIAAKEISEKTYNRMESLYRQGVTSEQKRDEALARRDASVAAMKAAYEQYRLALSGFREEEKRIAKANVAKENAKINQVKALLHETVLTAAADGRVTEVFLEPGELAGAGAPIMNVETDEFWFSFNITEDKLPGIDVGNTIKVYLPASGETLMAEVYRVKNVGDFASWKATRALEDLDLKVFEVRARPLRKPKAIHEGESVVLVK